MRLRLLYPAVALSAIVTLHAVAAVGGPSAESRIPVFVRTADALTGLSDPDKARTDSIKDIKGKLEESKIVRLAAKEEEAVIVLDILGRDTKFDEGHALRLFGGHGQKKSSVTVRVTAGDFQTEMTAEGGASGMFSGYGKAANQLRKDLEKWVVANRPKLDAMKADLGKALPVAVTPAPAPTVPTPAVAPPDPSPSPGQPNP